MKTKFPYGTTAQNNLLTLPQGFLTIDLDKKAIRLHDGVTQGGFEMIGTQAYTPPYSGPGPQVIAAGSSTKGWYGEVPASSLITGSALATAVALTLGTEMNPGEPWLKFSLADKTLFVARKPLRSNISWDNLNVKNLITGNTVITIGGHQYKVRLLKGVNANPSLAQSGFDPATTWGSEWNSLLYHVSAKPFAQAGNTLASEGITAGDWASYTEAQLQTNNASYSVPGALQWCQEVLGGNSTWRVARVGVLGGVSTLAGSTPQSDNGVYFGWRPVLEYIAGT